VTQNQIVTTEHARKLREELEREIEISQKKIDEGLEKFITDL